MGIRHFLTSFLSIHVSDMYQNGDGDADCNLLTNHKLIPYSSKYIMHCLRYRDMSNKKVDESFQKVCRLVMNTVVVLSSFLTSLSLRP